MKKFVLILVVLSLFGCSNPVNEPDVLTFEDAVQEVYEMTGRTLFYSLDGINPLVPFNKATGPNEIAGLCTDYSIEFTYYWNEVKNYDEVYGKAYFALISTGTSNNTILYFLNGNFVRNGTINYREEASDFLSNANTEALDGVWRDVIVTSIVYSGKNISHYGQYVSDHMWIVIKVGDDWYDTEPTNWDFHTDGNIFTPYVITF